MQKRQFLTQCGRPRKFHNACTNLIRIEITMPAISKARADLAPTSGQPSAMSPSLPADSFNHNRDHNIDHKDHHRVITLDALEQPVREDPLEFMELLQNTCLLMQKAQSLFNEGKYGMCVDICTTALEQVDYLEKSLHLAPRNMDIRQVLSVVDKSRHDGFVIRAQSNEKLGAPQELVDKDLESAESSQEYKYETRI